jgi:hypothetical protein
MMAYKIFLTATEDYLPGAIGGPAFGYALNTNLFQARSRQSAGPPTAHGR